MATRTRTSTSAAPSMTITHQDKIRTLFSELGDSIRMTVSKRSYDDSGKASFEDLPEEASIQDMKGGDNITLFADPGTDEGKAIELIELLAHNLDFKGSNVDIIDVSSGTLYKVWREPKRPRINHLNRFV